MTTPLTDPLKDQSKRRFTRGAYGWSLLGILIIGILAAACLIQRIHVVDPHLPYAIDLKPFYTKVFRDVGGADSSYVGYSGRRMIDGLPFDMGGEIVFYGRREGEENNDHPADVSGIRIDRKFDELHLVHAAQWRSYYGSPVATVRLHYSDGTSTDFTIRDKFQLDDWNRLLTENDELVADPDSKIIWRGAGIVKGTGRLFKSMLRNPFPDKKVDTMDIVSARSLMSYVLVAATVAQSDPRRELTPPLPLYPSRNFDGTLNVHIVDKETGKPIVGAEVDTAWTIKDICLVGDSVPTGADGIAAVKYPISETKGLEVRISKAGYLTCNDNWEHGWDGGSVPADITYKLAPGRDPILDARRVIGHWKRGSGLAADVDVTKSFRLYLCPKPAPLPMPPEANTPEKKQKWFRAWMSTDAGKKYSEAQGRARMLQLKADGTFSGASVAPGEYTVVVITIDEHGSNRQDNNRDVTVPPNPGNDPAAPVDLGEIQAGP